MSIKHIAFLLAALIALTACKKGEESSIPQAPVGDLPPVMVEELTLRNLDEYVTVSGKLEGVTNITMNSETSGRIVDLYKKLGDKVEKGERIGQVDNDVYRIQLEQAEATLQSAQVALENAQKNAAYAEESKTKNLISDLEYNTVTSSLKAAQASVNGAMANVESTRKTLENSYLTAPESGTITYMYVSKGQLINPGQAIAEIVDTSRMLIKTGVGESQITKVKPGQPVQVSHSGTDGTVSATVKALGISPIAGSASYPVEIELMGHNRLMPGMAVSAKIKVNTFKDMLYTTITNVLSEYGHTYVYTLVEGDIVQRKEVQLGKSIGENIDILSGVGPGDKIVVSGTDNLDDGIKVEVRK